MTEKKRNIIRAATEFFSSEGYTATSTQKIAKKAGVSEGLVFRHFGNKAGLLEVILGEGEHRIKSYYTDIVFETKPESVIEKTLNLPFLLSDEDIEFRKLQMKLAWELDKSDGINLEPLRLKLEIAFKKLGFDQPKLETETLLYLMSGINTALLQGTLKDAEQLRSFLQEKYLSR